MGYSSISLTLMFEVEFLFHSGSGYDNAMFNKTLIEGNNKEIIAHLRDKQNVVSSASFNIIKDL